MTKQTIAADRVRDLVVSGGTVPAAPTITAPSGTDISLTPTITLSAFSIANKGMFINSNLKLIGDQNDSMLRNTTIFRFFQGPFQYDGSI